MTRSHFIALADAIRKHNKTISDAYAARTVSAEAVDQLKFGNAHLRVLADFCAGQSPLFKGGRWLAYIAGECGPHGGSVK